jgi:hypothetical protein
MSEHAERFLGACRQLRPEVVDRNWRAFLWIATLKPPYASPDLWASVVPFVDFANATVDGAGLQGIFLCRDHRLLVSLALHLFDPYAYESPPLARLVTELDREHWGVVLEALSIMRGAWGEAVAIATTSGSTLPSIPTRGPDSGHPGEPRASAPRDGP